MAPQVIVGPRPYILKDVLFEIEDKLGVKHQFQCWLTGYSITSAEATTQDVTPLCPQVGTISLAGAAGSTTLTLDYLADWENPDSFSWFLVDNEGATELHWTLIDRAGSPTGVQMVGIAASLPEPGMGGTSGSPSTFTGVNVPLVGKPTRSHAIAAGQAATSTTSTSGGSVSPLGAVLPPDLATLKADPILGDGGTAAPAVDTPVGEFLTLADKTVAHYKSNAWVAGVAA